MKLKTLLKWYLKDRAGLFAAAALFWLIFSVVFCLYTESFEPLGYSWLLCLYFAVILTGAVKTPIAAMRLLLGEESFPLREEAAGELFKIEEYVDMVLQYLRTDEQTSDYVLQDCDLEKLVRGAVRKYAPQFIRKKLKISFQIQPVRVLTDEKWVGFIIGQILSNALKYTKRGTISIYQESGNPRRLIIEDTGIGIAPEDLPRVFERGYTGYNGRQDKRATGIGLYLAKKIADRLNHTIEIQSVQGQGTKVLLDFSREETMYD